MKNRREVGLLNPMRDKNWKQEPWGRKDNHCDHGLSRTCKVEVCEKEKEEVSQVHPLTSSLCDVIHPQAIPVQKYQKKNKLKLTTLPHISCTSYQFNSSIAFPNYLLTYHWRLTLTLTTSVGPMSGRCIYHAACKEPNFIDLTADVLRKYFS